MQIIDHSQVEQIALIIASILTSFITLCPLDKALTPAMTSSDMLASLNISSAASLSTLRTIHIIKRNGSDLYLLYITLAAAQCDDLSVSIDEFRLLKHPYLDPCHL